MVCCYKLRLMLMHRSADLSCGPSPDGIKTTQLNHPGFLLSKQQKLGKDCHQPRRSKPLPAAKACDPPHCQKPSLSASHHSPPKAAPETSLHSSARNRPLPRGSANHVMKLRGRCVGKTSFPIPTSSRAYGTVGHHVVWK